MAVIRTFIAVEVPESIKGVALALQDDLKRVDCRVSWTKPAGMHLTLKFLGDTDQGLIEEIGAALNEIAAEHRQFPLSLGKAGAFGGRNPRVLWLGFDESPELSRLQMEVENAVAQFGFSKENRKFHSHLTLCRVKDNQGASELVEILESSVFETETFEVDELVFFKSELKPAGAVYTPLNRAKLGR